MKEYKFEDVTVHDLKKKIGDTLNFLHQERNDFLPEDDLPIYTKVESKIVASTPKKLEFEDFEPEKEQIELLNSVKEKANEIIDDIINEAENHSSLENSTNSAKNEAQNLINEATNLDDSLNLAMKKSEEAFSFLEHEDDIIPLKVDEFIKVESYIPENKDFSESFEKIQTETKQKNKSNIPKLRSKEKYLKDEKDVDLVLSQEAYDNLSPVESDILSRIPVAASKQIKVKTIKKHSKDPLKDFVKTLNAETWDENCSTETYTVEEPDGCTTTTTIRTGPVKTTTFEYSTSNESPRSKTIEFAPNESPRSKIPVLVNELGKNESSNVESSKIEFSKVSSPTESHKDIVDSDSDTDSRQSPPLRGILKKSNPSMRTLGSSSGSDIALHEAGGELSDDDTGN